MGTINIVRVLDRIELMAIRLHDTKTNHNGMDLSFLESASFWSNVAVVAASVLTAIAAFLALYFSSQLSAIKDGNLERFKEEAESSIASANARAAEADSKSEKARLEAINVSKETALANERAGKLELEVAQQRKLTALANERAAEAKLELERLKTPRLLRPEQIESLITAMSEFKEQKVFFGVVSTTFEAMNFGSQLFMVLKAAGVDVTGRGPFVQRAIGIVRGMVVRHTTGNDRGQRFALAFCNALMERGVNVLCLDSLDEEIVQRMEEQQGRSLRNHNDFEHVAVAVGDKP